MAHLTQLCIQFALIATVWDADSQAMEGIISRVKRECVRSHKIGLPLLTAQIVVPNMCGLGTRNAPEKWSLIKPIVDNVLEQAECAYRKERAQAILAGVPQCIEGDDSAAVPAPSRWEAPAPTAMCAPRTHAQQDNDTRRASACSLRWYRDFEPREGLRCINECLTIGADPVLEMPGEAWLAALSHCLVGQLVKLVVVGAKGGEEGALVMELARPIEFASSIDVFKDPCKGLELDSARPIAMYAWELDFQVLDTDAGQIVASKPRLLNFLGDVLARVRTCAPRGKETRAPLPAPEAAREESEDHAAGLPMGLEGFLTAIIDGAVMMGDNEDDVEWGDAQDNAVTKYERSVVDSAKDKEEALRAVVDNQDPSCESAAASGVFDRLQERDAGLLSIAAPWRPSHVEATRLWMEALSQSLEAWTTRGVREQRALESGPQCPRPPGGWNLSLVIFPDEGRSAFLHWQEFGVSGQEVRLHDNNRIKFSTPYFFPIRRGFAYEWVARRRRENDQIAQS